MKTDFRVEDEVIRYFKEETKHALFFQSLKVVGVGVPDVLLSCRITGPFFAEFKLVESDNAKIPWRKAQLPWASQFIKEGGKSVAVIADKKTGDVWVVNMCNVKESDTLATIEPKEFLQKKWSVDQWFHPQLVFFKVLFYQDSFSPFVPPR